MPITKVVATPRRTRVAWKKSPVAVHARVKNADVVIRSKGSLTVVEAKTPRSGQILRWASELSPMELIEASKRGIRGRQLGQIQEQTNFSSEDWSRYLQLAGRTIQRYRKENSVITPASSERALLMAQIAERGRDVFGGEAKFKMWLDAPSFSLGGSSPNELLDTTTGMNVVKAELTRIEFGVY